MNSLYDKEGDEIKMWNVVEKILKERSLTIYRLSKMTGISDNTLRNYRTKQSDPS